MKKILPLLFLLISTAVTAQRYVPQDNGSKVHFNIRNFGIKTGGQLSGLKGEIVFFTTDLSACHFNVSVDVSTIDTDSDSRDRSLRSDEYFDEKNTRSLRLSPQKLIKPIKQTRAIITSPATLPSKALRKKFHFHFMWKR